MTNNLILKTEGLSKSFGGIKALDNVSVDVNKGEVIGIIGPNGSGKTTLFRLIMGIYRPDSGKIIFEGENLTGLPSYRVCQKGIALAHQIPKPFSRLTVMENLLVAALSGGRMTRKSAEEYCQTVLKLTGLYKVKDKLAGSLLPLELKRLEIARALASKPKLILLDEPAAGMREKDVDELLEIIKLINSEGVTVMLVEHRMEVVVKAVERLIALNRGTIVAQGPVKEVMNSKIVSEIYLGRRFREYVGAST
ncbi:MAG: ABC transporter ATP-binding protein [Candidatus Nezhaarchaeales archaeon]|nr:MAG: ABC transporter ATP-binding protein [Candidatus Nezhaarchaeota archaeon WYZ-LMO8]